MYRRYLYPNGRRPRPLAFPQENRSLPTVHPQPQQYINATVTEHAEGRCRACAGERLQGPLQRLFSAPIAASVYLRPRPSLAHRVPIDLVFHELALLKRVQNVLRSTLHLKHDAIYSGTTRH